MLNGQDIWKAAVLAIGLAVILPARGPAAAGVVAEQGAPQPADSLISLEDSTRPLEQYFNQADGRIRFLALLSPT
jgi:hypothetical protein